ncbi:MAG: hypothetical protein AB7H88_01655 [Vicinamibacterales bacterium]
MSAGERSFGSHMLMATAVALTIIGLVGSALGLKDLMDSLVTAGYGSVEVRNALVYMGLAGASLGTGISLLIWEIANRIGARK